MAFELSPDRLAVAYEIAEKNVWTIERTVNYLVTLGIKAHERRLREIPGNP